MTSTRRLGPIQERRQHMTKKAKHAPQKDERVFPKKANRKPRRKVGRRSEAAIHQNILSSELF